MIYNESDFIRRINSKEEVAFKELFNEYYNSLVLFAMQYIDQQCIAEDIVQDLFMLMWEQKTEYTSCHGLKTFLYHSVRNRCVDYYRHLDVEKRYLYSLNYEKNMDTFEELDDKIMKEELYKMLIDTIQQLPKACRKIFELHIEGKSNEEIARMLGLSILTVKTQKKRAMCFLKNQFKKTFIFFKFLYPF